jgi:hypothetical protein
MYYLLQMRLRSFLPIKRPVTYVRARADLHFRHSHTNTLHSIMFIQSAFMNYNYRCLMRTLARQCCFNFPRIRIRGLRHSKHSTCRIPRPTPGTRCHHSETISLYQQHDQVLT